MEIILDTFEYFMSFIDKWRVERLRQKYAIQKLIEQPFTEISKSEGIEIPNAPPRKEEKHFVEKVERRFLLQSYVDEMLKNVKKQHNFREQELPALQKLVTEHVEVIKAQLQNMLFPGAKLQKILPIQKSKTVWMFLLRFEQKGLILGSIVDIPVTLSYESVSKTSQILVKFAGDTGANVVIEESETTATFTCNVEVSCKEKGDKIGAVKSQLRKRIQEEWMDVLVKYDVEPRKTHRVYLFFIVERLLSPFDALKDILGKVSNSTNDKFIILLLKESLCSEKEYVEYYRANGVEVVVLSK